MIDKIIIGGMAVSIAILVKKVNNNKKRWNKRIKAKNNEKLNTLYIECINECERKGYTIRDEEIINAVLFEAENILLKRA